jgi:hypothetical protein
LDVQREPSATLLDRRLPPKNRLGVAAARAAHFVLDLVEPEALECYPRGRALASI